MTEQAMNVAIAELMGFSNCRMCSNYDIRKVGYCYHEESMPNEILCGNFNGGIEAVPNYTGDLNAIHDAVSTLTFTQRRLYRMELQMVMSGGLKEGVLVEMSECIDATAIQRAEAFLRTLGKWVD